MRIFLRNHRFFAVFAPVTEVRSRAGRLWRKDAALFQRTAATVAALLFMWTLANPSPSNAQVSFATNVGASTVQTITVSWPSDFTLGSFSAVTQGVVGLDFTLASSQPSSNACTTGNAYVAGNSCLINIQFSPAAPGLYSGAILFYSNAGALETTVYINGLGRSSEIAFDPPVVSTSLKTFSVPASLVVDPRGVGSGMTYVGDLGLHQVLKVDPSGTATVFAGTGNRGNSGDGGPAVQAAMTSPSDVALDGAGNLYIADALNCTVRKVDSGGIISTPVGTGTCGYAGDGGPATSAQLNLVFALTIDGSNNLYIADTANNVVRKVDTAGIISTFAGTGSQGFGGDGGPANRALLDQPLGLRADSLGNIFIADTNNNVIRKVDASTGVITTVAGNNSLGAGYTGDGGPASSAQLNGPFDLAVDAGGELFISDTGNAVIRKVDAAGIITSYYKPGAFYPSDVVVDAVGNLAIVDSNASALFTLGRSIPPSLSFGSQAVGTSSAPIAVTATNIGNQSLNFTQFTLSSGDYNLNASSTTCSTSTPLLQGLDCSMGIDFAPITPGLINGTLTLNDNSLAPGASTTQVINLSGTGTLAVATTFNVTAAQSSVSVAQGSSVNITVTVPSVGSPYNNPVTMSASGLPTGSIANFNPPVVTPGTSGATTVITVQMPKMMALGSARPPRPFQLASIGMGLVGFVLLYGFKRSKFFRLADATITLAAAIILCSGCNGALSHGPTPLAGKYAVTITGSSGAHHVSTTVTLVVR